MNSYRVLILAALLLVTASCSREAKNSESSTLIFSIPKGDVNSKVGALGAALPANRKACYGVNITANDLPAVNSACSPMTGIVGGFIEEGGKLELNVPSGKARKIDLYIFLQPEGANSPCPGMSANLGGINAANTFFSGSTTKDLVSKFESVDIALDFPGEANNFVQQLGLPSTCIASSTPPVPNAVDDFGFKNNLGSGTAIGGGLRMKASVGFGPNAITATGGGYKLKVEVLNQ